MTREPVGGNFLIQFLLSLVNHWLAISQLYNPVILNCQLCSLFICLFFGSCNDDALPISFIFMVQTIWLPTSAENWLTILFILLMYLVVIKYLEKEVQALHKLTFLYVIELAI